MKLVQVQAFGVGCVRCGAEAAFPAAHPGLALLLAAAAGWESLPGDPSPGDLCPSCAFEARQRVRLLGALARFDGPSARSDLTA